MLREQYQYNRQSHRHLQNVSIGDIMLGEVVDLTCLCWKNDILQN